MQTAAPSPQPDVKLEVEEEGAENMEDGGAAKMEEGPVTMEDGGIKPEEQEPHVKAEDVLQEEESAQPAADDGAGERADAPAQCVGCLENAALPCADL